MIECLTGMQEALGSRPSFTPIRYGIGDIVSALGQRRQEYQKFKVIGDI